MLLWEDNSAVVGILRNLTTRSPGMRADLAELIAILEAKNILLQVRYIKSVVNPSDWYSRVVDKAQWQLEPSLAHKLVHRWGYVLTIE